MSNFTPAMPTGTWTESELELLALRRQFDELIGILTRAGSTIDILKEKAKADEERHQHELRAAEGKAQQYSQWHQEAVSEKLALEKKYRDDLRDLPALRKKLAEFESKEQALQQVLKPMSGR